jgi:hypothetical protein
MRPGTLKSIVTSAVILTVMACTVSDIASVKSDSTASGDLAGIGATLVECPESTSSTASTLLGPLGGVLSAGGATVIVPQGALLEPVNVTLTVPASQYVEIDVSVSGVDHFLFELPVTVVISYARCNRSNLDRGSLTAWYIDRASKTLLAPMGGVDNKLLRTVTFTTGHLSGYALAN